MSCVAAGTANCEVIYRKSKAQTCKALQLYFSGFPDNQAPRRIRQRLIPAGTVRWRISGLLQQSILALGLVTGRAEFEFMGVARRWQGLQNPRQSVRIRPPPPLHSRPGQKSSQLLLWGISSRGRSHALRSLKLFSCVPAVFGGFYPYIR